MSDRRIEDLLAYVQERCLWQFHSRSWDRVDNIEGVLSRTQAILADLPIQDETDADRCWHADAKILAMEFRQAFPWIKDMKPAELEGAFAGLKSRMLEVTVEKSKNEELKVPNY